MCISVHSSIDHIMRVNFLKLLVLDNKCSPKHCPEMFSHAIAPLIIKWAKGYYAVPPPPPSLSPLLRERGGGFLSLSEGTALKGTAPEGPLFDALLFPLWASQLLLQLLFLFIFFYLSKLEGCLLCFFVFSFCAILNL